MFVCLTVCFRQKLFIDPVKKEFSAVALQVLSEEMAAVRKAHASRTSPTTVPSSGEGANSTPVTTDS